MRLSKSKINTYLKCPREFKYRYIDEIETPPNEYMALGSDVHLIAENYAKIYGDNPQEKIKEMIAFRGPIYEKAATSVIDVDGKGFEEILSEIQEIIHKDE